MQTHTSKHTLCPEACFPWAGQSISHARLGTWQLCDTIQVRPQWRRHCGTSSPSAATLFTAQHTVTTKMTILAHRGEEQGSAKIVIHCVLCLLRHSSSKCVPIYRACSHCQPHSREEGRDSLKDTQRWEGSQVPLHVREVPLHDETLLFADPTSLKECVLILHPFPKSSSICHRFFPSSSCDEPRYCPMPTAQVSPRHSAVISMFHVPPQWALRNTPQVEVVELGQNENHLERGKGGSEREREKRRKKRLMLDFVTIQRASETT